ncbi:MAG: RecX family transcriptional regulator [Bacteroides sp.]|nr:RecX family transcriptional regulator [Bacteroides sp.]
MTEAEALRKVTSHCSCGERCRAEVVEKMQRWGLPYATIDRIVEQMVQEKYIDEERYCKAFVHDKYRLEKWGKQKIAQALQLKKIPSVVYWPYLNGIDQEEYLDILNKLLLSKRKSIHAADEYELNGKLIRFALSRGFEMDDIRRCIPVEEENGNLE